MKQRMHKHVCKYISNCLAALLLCILASAAVAQEPPTPVTIRLISIAPGTLTAIFPNGLYTDGIDLATTRRLEAAIQQKRGSVIAQWQNAVKAGQQERFSQIKTVRDGASYNLGLEGAVDIVNTPTAPWRLAKITLQWTEAGSSTGPNWNKGEKLNRRCKQFEASVFIKPGMSSCLGIFPACPTDGNRNLLVTTLSIGGQPPANAGEERPPERTLVVELFALPTGTVSAPDLATLLRLRQNPKSNVAETKLRGAADARCIGASVTNLTYFPVPGHTEARDLGLSVEMAPEKAETKVAVTYTTLMAPYTPADHKRAGADPGRPNANPEEFREKHRPHFVGMRGEAQLPNSGEPIVVRLQNSWGGDRQSERPSKSAGLFCADLIR